MEELIAASPALGDEDSEESGTCPKHPNGNRWSFYDRHVADMTWHCWDCLEEYVAALRARIEALEAGLREVVRTRTAYVALVDALPEHATEEQVLRLLAANQIQEMAFSKAAALLEVPHA